ncbi:MAG: PEP/pyruvate-binding domain-containing protein [Pseudomonadota bacterium]
MIKKFNIFRKRPHLAPHSKEDLSLIFRAKYSWFKELLSSNSELLNIIADMEEKLRGEKLFGMAYIRAGSTRAVFHIFRMVKCMNILSNNKDVLLYEILEKINEKLKRQLGKRKEIPLTKRILPYSEVTRERIDWVGGKNANLGEVYSRVRLPIPEGFAITTHAFNSFLAHNDLIDEINKLKLEIDPDDPKTVNRVSEKIQEMIITASIPKELEEEILSSHARLVEATGTKGSEGSSTLVSMRSSAIGEDSELSYAGQYLSALNVPPDKLIQTYKYIVASLYTPRAIAYRLNKGILDEDIAMGVACLEMVESVASGVMYSTHPLNPLEKGIIINAVWGLGPYAVEGVITPDTYVIEKDDTLHIIETRISNKPVQLVSNPDGGVMEVPVPKEIQERPCLNPDQIKTLAGYAVKLENHFGCPQDIEWVLDSHGRLLVLQTRPLPLKTNEKGVFGQSAPKMTGYPLLLENGAVAFPGVGFGPAFQVRSEEDLENFPDGAVLVAEHSSPKFMVVMGKAQAIVTDAGSVTGHMASLVREFCVPSILGAKTATVTIPQGMDITVDAYSGRVYKGKVEELLALQTSRRPHMKDTPVYRTLKQVADLIIPLHLLDPKSPDFAPQSCQTLHDIMRFVHERSYTEMFQISDLVSYKGGGAVKLDAPIPLDLYIIDLEGGLKEMKEGAKKAAINNIASAPLKAILKGMMHDDLRWREPRPIQLKGLLSVMTEQMLSPPHAAGERFGDRSYAIISDKYLNFSSRVGYHYSVLDSYCGKTINKNYITFSFKGGAADDVRRNRRARAIAMMLEASGFSVEVVGDRVYARLQKYEQPVIEEKLDTVGRLLQFTRQMDMLMDSEASVEATTKAFLEGNYRLEQKP